MYEYIRSKCGSGQLDTQDTQTTPFVTILKLLIDKSSIPLDENLYEYLIYQMSLAVDIVAHPSVPLTT